MDEMVLAALQLMPPMGTEVEFDAYKDQLYTQNPKHGRDVFAHIIKRDLVNKKLSRNNDGKIVVMLSLKAAK